MMRRTPELPRWLGRLLCMLGFHDFRIVEVSFGFGPGNKIERIECRRCGLTATRHL